MTTTPTVTLTDRYVDATLRRVPAHQRADIERELRASIEDAVEAQVEAGAPPDEAERAVLTGLGDPVRLAAGYADRPLHLIGPAFFLPYTRLLTALTVTVVPVVAAIVGFTRAMDGGNVGQVVGGVIGGALTTAIQIAFWTTLLFAVLERVPDLRNLSLGEWTVDRLPEAPAVRARYVGIIAETVMLALFTVAVLLSPLFGFRRDGAGDPISFLTPWLWDTGVVYVLVVLWFAALSVSYVKLYARWNQPLALTGALINVASAGVIVWLGATDHVLNPDFAAAANWVPGVTDWINKGMVIAGVLSIIVTVVELIRGYASQSWEQADLGTTVREAVHRIPGVRD
jgi:hypothetical protein